MSAAPIASRSPAKLLPLTSTPPTTTSSDARDRDCQRRASAVRSTCSWPATIAKNAASAGAAVMINTTLPAVVWSVAVVKKSWLAVIPTAAHPSSRGTSARGDPRRSLTASHQRGEHHAGDQESRHRECQWVPRAVGELRDRVVRAPDQVGRDQHDVCALRSSSHGGHAIPAAIPDCGGGGGEVSRPAAGWCNCRTDGAPYRHSAPCIPPAADSLMCLRPATCP